ncbi:MAG: glutamate formimidoyltransferase [Acidobacteriaceae bacterium]|nr:glutamate formimidoyltransferase [Acidobacteriaceae bacterium]
MNASLIECVPNFSEGRDLMRVDALQRAIDAVPGVAVLDRTSDSDHNRSVITFAGSPEAVLEAAVRAVRTAAELIDLNTHRGVHPRVGALDVLPFVPLGQTSMEECVRIAHRAGERIWHELGIPVYFYEAVAMRPDRIKLEDVRRGQFEGLREAALVDQTKAPDLGGPGLHPTAGAVLVGARKVLIAFNINLKTNDLQLARSIARRIRASNGGFPNVKALGLPLASRNRVQISMNFTDYHQTSVYVVYEEVMRLAAAQGVEVEGTELVGLIPRAAVEAGFAEHSKPLKSDPDKILESRVEKLLHVSGVLA